MYLAKNHEKSFFYASVVLYILGWIAGSDHILLALLCFGSSAFCVLKTDSTEFENKKELQTQNYVVLAAFFIPAFIFLWTGYHDSADTRNFKNYLSEHNCKDIGITVTGMSKGGCDRFNNCEEPQEIEETQFFCAATKKRLTFTDFKSGSFGR